VKVYLCDCAGIAETVLTRFLAALPPGRRAYAARCKRALDRAAAAVGFLLVSKALGDADPAFTPADWATGEHGKPFLPGSSLHFSLSHSDGLCAAAVSDRPIGLDVELIRPLRAALLPRFCTPEEIGRAERDPDLAVELWTKREARAKENGRGIGQNLVALPIGGVASVRLEADGRAFFLSCTSDEPPEILRFTPEELLS